MSISELLAGLVVILWVICIFLRGLIVDTPQAQRASAPARRPPAGYEWRKAARLGRRLVAVRLQVILA